MKIDSYEVQSSSQRNYLQIDSSIVTTRLVSEAELEKNQQLEQPAAKLELNKNDPQPTGELKEGKTLADLLKSRKAAGISALTPFATDPNDLKIKLLEMMIYALTGKRVSVRNISKEVPEGQQQLGQTQLISANSQPRAVMRQVTEAKQFHYESESVQYQAQGIIKTADGKTISVDVGMSMSRQFMSYSNTSVVWEQPVDPLVINYGGTAASLTQQKYDFDLTMDGVTEQISFAGPGSGFLALDKDGDGVINDGSELFGPQNGDGFAELRKYDQDSNGWIDENDGIFDKLLVWSKDENGNDQLFKLKDLDIGAIYLGNVDTQFSLNDDQNQTNGVMRSTSFFLKESGGAGTISQVDLMI